MTPATAASWVELFNTGGTGLILVLLVWALYQLFKVAPGWLKVYGEYVHQIERQNDIMEEVSTLLEDIKNGHDSTTPRA